MRPDLTSSLPPGLADAATRLWRAGAACWDQWRARLWRPRVVDAVLGATVVGIALAAMVATWVGAYDGAGDRSSLQPGARPMVLALR